MMIAEEYVPADPEERWGFVQTRGFPVVIYQSASFRPWISEATWRMQRLNLGEIMFTPLAGDETLAGVTAPDPTRFPRSLDLMRREMMGRPDVVGAVFLGGMEGIEAEAELFRIFHDHLPTYFVGAPGGAAREILEASIQRAREHSINDLPWLEELLTAREYPALMQQIVADMAKGLS